MKSLLWMQGNSALEKETYIINEAIETDKEKRFDAGSFLNKASKWKKLFEKEIETARLKSLGVSSELQCFFDKEEGIMIQGSFKEKDSQNRFLPFSCYVNTTDIEVFYETLDRIVAKIDKTYYEKDKELIVSLFKSHETKQKITRWILIALLLGAILIAGVVCLKSKYEDPHLDPQTYHE